MPMTIKCKQCQKTFTLSDSEIEFYKKKNLQLPKRCRECRELNKKNKAKENTFNAQQPIRQEKSDSMKMPALKGGKSPGMAVGIIAIAIVAAVFFSFLPESSPRITDDTPLQQISSAVTTAPAETTAEKISLISEETSYPITGNNEIIPSETAVQTVPVSAESEETLPYYHFRKGDYLEEHYQKHGVEMGFSSDDEYEKAANRVVNDPDVLVKTEKEDGDYVYYLEVTNEFVILSTDGYLRTYFYPTDGKDYFDRQ